MNLIIQMSVRAHKLNQNRNQTSDITCMIKLILSENSGTDVTSFLGQEDAGRMLYHLAVENLLGAHQ